MIAKNVPDKAHSEQSEQSEQRIITVDATSYTLVGMLLRDGTVMECLVDPTELEDSAVLGTAQYGDKRCTVLQLRSGERVLYL